MATDVDPKKYMSLMLMDSFSSVRRLIDEWWGQFFSEIPPELLKKSYGVPTHSLEELSDLELIGPDFKMYLEIEEESHANSHHSAESPPEQCPQCKEDYQYYLDSPGWPPIYWPRTKEMQRWVSTHVKVLFDYCNSFMVYKTPELGYILVNTHIPAKHVYQYVYLAYQEWVLKYGREKVLKHRREDEWYIQWGYQIVASPEELQMQKDILQKNSHHHNWQFNSTCIN